MDASAALNAVDWSAVRTADGAADDVPKRLAGLLQGQEAMQNVNALAASLCPDQAALASAALPALPFLLQALDGASPPVAVEILDLLVGMAGCDTDGTGRPGWIDELHAAIEASRERFVALGAHDNEDLAQCALLLLATLDGNKAEA